MHEVPPSKLVEIALIVAYAPRQAQEIENMILLSPGVQSCLKAAPEIRAEDFTIGFNGQLTSKGELEHLTVTHASSSLKSCLMKEMSRLAFGKGRSGPLKMQLTRNMKQAKKLKPILLDLSTGNDSTKKWE